MFPRQRPRLTSLSLLLAVLIVLALTWWYQSRERVPRTFATTPADIDALRSLQERVRTAARRVTPAVVAVESAEGISSPRTKRPRVFERYCSGVIITADGLILSQFHVSHWSNQSGWRPGDPIRSRRPGERATVILHDGRKLEAELLGADQTFDLSLLRLVEPGPYPFVPLEPSATVELGDWVLKLGHPIGYRRDRPPVLRLGRVLFRQKEIFVTDCFMTGGDSGGPFFDLDGRLIGIHKSSSVPAKLSNSFGFGPEGIRLYSSTATSVIRRHLDSMLRGEIVPPDRTASKELHESYRDSDRLLPKGHQTQGATTAQAFRQVVRNSRRSVVSVLDEDGRDVALGTVVGADGWVVTVASLLPAEPRCRLRDAQVVTAEVVGMQPAFDLALLKLPVTGLQPVTWSRRPSPVAGTILAAVGTAETPLAIGVVSVPRRDLPGPFPTRVTPSRLRAEPPAVNGRPVEGGLLVDSVGVTAADAGIQVGDVVRSIAGREIRTGDDLPECVRGLLAGDRVSVHLVRDGERKELTLVLAPAPEPLRDSKPFADFPTLFEHDMPLPLSSCGGPVVDLDGEAVGVTVYPGLYGCMAIPGDCIERLLPEMKADGLADKWVKPPAAGPDT